MAKSRYVQDSFWTDPYIEKLTPDEKLVFLHLLTNPQCTIAGVYELRSKRLAYETGYDVEIIENILKRFENSGKIIRFNDWIVIVNHLKHQSLGNDTAKGVQRVINEAPLEVQQLFSEKELTNSKGEVYLVPVLNIIRPPTDPLQTPPNGVYSVVKLSKVKLSNKYGEFENVNLTDEELLKLNERFGTSKVQECIEELSGYMASKGKRYSNHYATLLNWAKRKSEVKNYKAKSVSII